MLIATTSDTPLDRLSAYREIGCELLELPPVIGRPGVQPLLNALGGRRMTNILVEGGGAVLGSFLDAKMIDEVHVFIATRLLGGAQAVTPIAGRGIEDIANSVPLAEWTTEIVEDCVMIHGRVSN